MAEIRNKEDLIFKKGSLVYIDHKIARIRKDLHKRIEKHIDTGCIVLKILEKEDYDAWHNPYTYYVYQVLVGNERLEFGQEVLSSKPVDKEDFSDTLKITIS